jgi:DHA1 family multidrug resistance protein-like MFS transporter
MVAVGFIHFSLPLYKGMGVAKGVSILGGISVLGVAGVWVLYLWGDKLRARSKFAVS